MTAIVVFAMDRPDVEIENAEQVAVQSQTADIVVLGANERVLGHFARGIVAGVYFRGEPSRLVEATIVPKVTL